MAVDLRTAATAYDWLNRSLFIAAAARAPEVVTYDAYRVT